MRRSLLEDAALELTACGSPMLVWWSGGAAALVLRLASMGKAVLVFGARGFSFVWVMPWCFSCGEWVALIFRWRSTTMESV
jgi:hypothetical protein